MICKERAYAVINLDNIRKNVINIKNNIDTNSKIIAVVKTDGYGHGALRIAKELDQMEEVDFFAVATIEEAMDLKDNGVKTDILILGYCFPTGYETIVNNDIRSTVFDYETAKELSDIAVKNNTKAQIHIKVDTGMSRIGLIPNEDGIELVKKIYKLPGINIEGMFTHFARADERDKTYINNQFNIFTAFNQKLKAVGINIPILHCSNSAAIVDSPFANLNMVRAGIILYGLWPSNEVQKDNIKLYPAMELKSTVVYVKTIDKDTQISYGGTYCAKDRMTIATVSIGYGDGYPRCLSNKGYVLIRGQKAPILGRVCMDQLMVDVSHIEGVVRGDTVTLVGIDGENSISMEEFSALANTINYESVCDIGKRVPRLYIKGDVLE